jgi:outer membrane protein
MENNLEIKRQEIETDRRAIQLNSDKMSLLPDLNMGGTQKFDFGRSLNRENTYDDVNSRNSAFSLTTEAVLFDGMKAANTIAYRKLELNINELNHEKIKNDISLRITALYFQILLNKEVLNIAKEQVALSEELKNVTGILVSNGKVAGSQVYDVQAQAADDELNVTRAENALRLSIVDIAQLLEIDDVESFDIDSLRKDATDFVLKNPNEIYETALGIMPEIRGAELSVESNEKAIKVSKSGYYPTISFAAGVSSNYYNFSNSDNLSFGNQIDNNLQKTIYLTLRIPLFNRFATRNAVRMARKDYMESLLVKEQTHKTLFKEIQKAYYDALSAKEKYASTEKSVSANAEAMRYALEKYNAGSFTIYEYNEIKLKLASSRSEMSKAKYEFMLQKKILDFYSGNAIQ